MPLAGIPGHVVAADPASETTRGGTGPGRDGREAGTPDPLDAGAVAGEPCAPVSSREHGDLLGVQVELNPVPIAYSRNMGRDDLERRCILVVPSLGLGMRAPGTIGNAGCRRHGALLFSLAQARTPKWWNW